MVTLPTTASRGIFGSCRTFATKSCGPGISGWHVEREDGRSYGTPSTRSSPVTPCQRPGSFTATPDGSNLTREEPDASVALVRDCGGRGGVTSSPTRRSREAGSQPWRYQRSSVPTAKLCRRSCTRGSATPADKVGPRRGIKAWTAGLIVPGWIDCPEVNEKADASGGNVPSCRRLRSK